MPSAYAIDVLLLSSAALFLRENKYTIEKIDFAVQTVRFIEKFASLSFYDPLYTRDQTHLLYFFFIFITKMLKTCRYFSRELIPQYPFYTGIFTLSCN